MPVSAFYLVRLHMTKHVAQLIWPTPSNVSFVVCYLDHISRHVKLLGEKEHNFAWTYDTCLKFLQQLLHELDIEI